MNYLQMEIPSPIYQALMAFYIPFSNSKEALLICTNASAFVIWNTYLLTYFKYF